MRICATCSTASPLENTSTLPATSPTEWLACCIDVFWPCDGSIDDLEVFGLRLEVLGRCGELDPFVSITDEGDMAFLRKKVKSGAAVGKLALL
ncbi:hypothetical protein Tco_0407253 [Tanacetum coccineum]